MEHEFRDAEHYASTIRDIILTTEPENGEEPLPENLVKYWADNLYNACLKAYHDYLIGKRDDFRLTDEESYAEYDKAGIQFTQELVDSMVDKDLLQVSISPEGEFLYSTTAKGQKAAKKYELDNNLNIKRRGRPRKK
jgi:hypothetical protein